MPFESCATFWLPTWLCILFTYPLNRFVPHSLWCFSVSSGYSHESTDLPPQGQHPSCPLGSCSTLRRTHGLRGLGASSSPSSLTHQVLNQETFSSYLALSSLVWRAEEVFQGAGFLSRWEGHAYASSCVLARLLRKVETRVDSVVVRLERAASDGAC